MSKKKAIKLATASAIAASAFVAANPNASEAATNVDAVVSQAKAQMRNAYYTYSHTVTNTGQFADIKAVYAEYNKAKKAYADAVALVKKAGGANKDAYLADLDATYEVYITSRVIPYIDAYNYAVKLDAMRQELQAAVDAKDLAKVEELYHKISYELKSRTVILDRVYGQTTRELLRSQFKAAAQQLRDSLIYDVTVSMKLKATEEATNKGDLAAAEKALAEAQDALTKATAFKADLTTKQATVKAAYEAKVTPAVVSVSAINLREVVVTFNKALNADELKKTSNYVFGTSTNPEAVTLSEDGKSVTLRLANANALGNYSTNNKLTINKAVGFTADVVVENIKASDSIVPVAEKVEVVGPRSLKITFSEPLDERVSAADTVASFKLDNGQLALDTTSAVYNGRTLTIKTLADLAEGEHKLELLANKNIKDAAGFVAAPASLNFTFVKDTTAPTAQVVDSTETTVTIKFSKPVVNVTSANVAFRHTYNTSVNEVLGSSGSVTNPSGDNQTFVIDFGPSNKPFPPGTTNLYIEYLDNNGTVIEDSFGNKFAETSFTVTTTADTVKPTVESVEFVDVNKVKVTFSEAVEAGSGTNGAENPANYTLKDASGATIPVTGAVFASGSNKVVELTTGTINGGTHTLEIKNIKDRSIAKNMLDTVAKTFVATDKVAPTVKDKDSAAAGIQVKKVADKKVKIEFSEAMDVASITDKSVYRYDGAALPSGATVEAVDGNKAVIITLPSTVDDTKDITLARVKDAAGNWIEAFSTTLDILPLTNVGVEKVEVTGKNTIKLTIDDIVSGATASDFEVSIDDDSDNNSTAGDPVWGSATVTGVSTTVDGGKTYITLKIAQDITDTSVSGVNAVRVRTTDGTTGGNPTANAKNQFGTPLQFTSSAAEDKYAPKVVSRTTKDTNKDGHIDAVEVVFSENLYVASVQDADFTVEGYEVTGVNVTAGSLATDKVVISLKEKSEFDTSATPKVQLVGEVEDARRNKLAAETSGTAAADGAAPVLVAAKITTAGSTAGFGNDVGDQLTLTFSEAVNTNFAAATAPTVAELDAIFAGTGGAKFAAADTVTFTATDLSSTASKTLVLTVASGSLSTAIVAGDVITTEATPTANDIEDAQNITIAGSQANVTVE